MSHSHNRVYHWFINTENVENMFFLTNGNGSIVTSLKKEKNFESAIMYIIPAL